jgi:hypothetical protein
LEATSEKIQKKMEESLKEMAIQTEQQLKGQKQDLEVGIWRIDERNNFLKLQAKNMKEMSNLKELLESQGINLDQMKLDISWTDLIKVSRFMVK